MYVHTQSLRGFPVQPLRGLGAVSPQEAQLLLTPLAQSVRTGLDELVAEAEDKSAVIANSIKMSWWQHINPFEPSEAEVREAANEWARNIVSYAENVKASLSRTDSSGQPLFIRKTSEAEQILRTAKRDLVELIRDYSEAAASTTFESSISRIIEMLISVVLQIAQIVVKAVGKAIGEFPVGALAIAAVLGIGAFAYLKFMRIL